MPADCTAGMAAPRASGAATGTGKLAAMTRRLTHLIDGHAHPGTDGALLDVHEPATGAVFATCPDGGPAEIDAAVQAAAAAFPAW